MSARLRATWLAAVLMVAFVVVLMVQPTGYTVLSPGETVNLLGANGSSALITVQGHKSYHDQGQLRMLTVELLPPSQKVSLQDAIIDWLKDDTSVYPMSVWYPPGTSDSSSVQQGAQQMTSAMDLARAAALQAAKIPFTTQTNVAAVLATGPSKGKVDVGDVVVSVNGHAVTDSASMLVAVQCSDDKVTSQGACQHKYTPGYVAKLVVKRKGKLVPVSIKTESAQGAPRVGVSVQSSYVFPFKITVNMPDNIGGGSGGMMLALTMYDLLTSGHLTDGHVIAGTGTIASGPGPGLGAVGPIGGIDQKIKAAQRDGAQLFLAPATNCSEVKIANYNHKTMKIVAVSTLEGAITAIQRWTKNPDDPALKGC